MEGFLKDAQHLSLGLVGGGSAARRLVDAAVNIDSANIRAVVCKPGELTDSIPCEDRIPSYALLLRRNDINAVYLATPVHTHIPLALEAVHAGKHVLIEKPLALSLCDLRRLELASDRLVVGTAFKKRFGAGIEYLRGAP